MCIVGTCLGKLVFAGMSYHRSFLPVKAAMASSLALSVAVLFACGAVGQDGTQGIVGFIAMQLSLFYWVRFLFMYVYVYVYVYEAVCAFL